MGSEAQPSITPTVSLDKNQYSWTERVVIEVMAPDWNLDPNKIDTIGTSDENKVTISTRGNSIEQYKLVESSENSGQFIGWVVLTGDPNVKGAIGTDGKGRNPSGAGPSGIGPYDGLLPSEESDGISVTFHDKNQTVTTQALIRWNVAQVSWILPFNTTREGNGFVLKISDPDMITNPLGYDSFLTTVYSDSDLAGIQLNMTKNVGTGDFYGVVNFTNFTSHDHFLHVTPGNNTITAFYTDRTLPAPYTPNDQIPINATAIFHNGNTNPTVSLDKNQYAWTDRAMITVIAPDQNLNPNKKDVIGNNNNNGLITISTRGHTISQYKLVETGPNTGIFVGHVTLSGDPTIKGISGVDGYGLGPSGAGPSGTGAEDGLIPAGNIDGLSVSYQTKSYTTVASAPINWNLGNVFWYKDTFTQKHGTCRVDDPDLNVNPNRVDKSFINTWSDSDTGGIKLALNETGISTGKFKGDVYFTSGASSGNHLHTNPNDVVYCEYKDRTLPLPYTPADQLRKVAVAKLTTVPLIPTSLNITSSINPSTFGQMVDFTPTLNFSSSSKILPSGKIQLFDGNILVMEMNGGPGFLNSGIFMGTYTLGVGIHNMTFNYSGDVSYAPSTSSVLLQVVTK